MGNMIVITRRLPEEGLSRIRQAGETWVSPWDGDMPRSELLHDCPRADILVATPNDRVDGELMDAHSELKLVANYAVGFNNIDLDAARGRGITVTNTPGVLTEATADLAMALILATARRLVEGDRLVRRGEFKGIAPEFHLGWDLQGRTLGIFGLGRIGAALAVRARAFGLKIIYHNRRPTEEIGRALEAEYVSFDDLLARSDFLSVNAPLTDETNHRFTMTEFRAMKQSAIIINTGRGPLIKEDDLAEALGLGLIAAAGLDVYEKEPNVTPALLEMENVVLSPHLGSATKEVRIRMAHLVADNVLAFVQGRTPPHVVV